MLSETKHLGSRKTASVKRPRFFAAFRMTGLLIVVVISLSVAADAMRTIETQYYIIHTDLAELPAREASIRITKMTEEYGQRTRGFAGRIEQKFPFYLYQATGDYYAAGGPKGTCGVFDGKQLMAVAGEKLTGLTWQTIQHEGFHQFARNVIRGNLSPWLNEGLAEYFGEAIFTGDGYVVGVIPPWRAKRIRRQIENGQFRSMRDMLNLPAKDWNSELALVNYDQAWSMVQFLAHGNDDRYQSAFEQFMLAISTGAPTARAWEKNFGNIENLESRWTHYWTSLPEDPTPAHYAKAVTSILTSFTARTFAQQQTCKTFTELAQAGRDGQLRMSDDDWLPPSLMTDALAAVERMQADGMKFELKFPARSDLPQIICTLRNGAQAIGTFKLTRDGRFTDIRVDLSK